MKRPDVSAELTRRGLADTDIASHSTRKGAATFLSSGSTACPSQSAITLRVGWALGGVQDTYIRYEAAGDQYVGRTVCGLPSDSPDFAMLPPHFPASNAFLVQAVRTCFPGAPVALNRTLEMCLASLVYHHDFLQRTLPPSHKLFSTALFTDTAMLGRLQNLVVCQLPDRTTMRATGIPPHITILTKMASLETKMDAVPQLVAQVIEGVTQVLEDRAIGAGTVTRDGLHDMLKDILSQAGVYDAVKALRGSSLPAANSSGSSSEAAATGTAYLWGGSFHLVPEDFSFPVGSALVAWQHYVCGNSSKGYPPLRRLTPSDMSTKDKKKRLSDYKFIMERIRGKVEHDGNWHTGSISLTEANDMFQIGQPTVLMSNSTPGNRKRRLNQMTWLTNVKEIRKASKRAIVASAAQAVQVDALE